MTRSHGKHPPPPTPAEVNGLKTEMPPTDDTGPSPLYRIVVYVWALAFLALIVQAFLDLIFGAMFGPVGR